MNRAFLLAFALLMCTRVGYCDGDQIQSAENSEIHVLLSLMNGLGTIQNESVRKEEQGGCDVVTVEAAECDVQFKLLRVNHQLLSAVRSASARSDRPLNWAPTKAMQVASEYISKLGVSHEDLGSSPLVARQNLDGSRNLWSVQWSRIIKGYPVLNDFVTVTFDESEGLFGFARSWSSPEPENILCKPVPKSEALMDSQQAAEQVMKKFSRLFAHYRLGKATSESLIIVAPNNVLSSAVRSEGDLLNGDTAHPRLAWVTTFLVEVDPSSKEGLIPEVSGLTIWIDAETHACIGAIF